MIKKIFLPGILLLTLTLHAQTDSTKKEKKIPVTFDGYVDAYYAWSTPHSPYQYNYIIPFYSHARRNEININHALISAHYKTDDIRANIGLHAGTYVNANGPNMLYEANAGVRLCKGIWLDAGIFPSHIGIETAISKDNATLTRSLSAEFSPYYETGAKITCESLNKWTFSAFVLNGWQNVYKFTNSIAGGTQITFKPNDRFVFNSSTYYGEAPVNILPFPGNNVPSRFFHDFYITWKTGDHFDLSALYDIGFQKNSVQGVTENSTWMTSALISRVTFNDKWRLALRGEYTSDPDYVQLSYTQTNAISVNLDYSPYKNVWLRAEAKGLMNKDNYTTFPDKSLFIATGSLAVAF